MRIQHLFIALLLASLVLSQVQAQSADATAAASSAKDPLPSWNETDPKRAIIAFVKKVTTEGSDGFVPEPERIAVFDNDGTLWIETPIPVQAVFAFDEVKRLAPLDPKLAADPMVQASLAGDLPKLLAGKHHDGLMHILGLTHAGMTTVEFDDRVENWLTSAKHPRFDRLYTDLTYQPMQELLRYLRANGFKTFIVSGGGADFMRVFSERVYGIPPENVVGSTALTKFELRDGSPVLIKTTDQLFVDDKDGKPVGIHEFIGRRPIACFGNSDGDQAMLEYTTIDNPRSSFGLIVHHTDADREYAYDANPQASGKLTTALEDAPSRGWTVVDMKNDWNRIWSEPSEQSPEISSKSPVGKWLAEDIGGRGVVDRAQSTLELSKDGSVSGSTAVNRYSGKAKLSGQEIEFGPLATTRRAGPPALMDQELRFTSALSKARGFRFDDNGLLYLTDAEGHDLIRFSKMTD